jgi:uncharacterized GH25 family protein
MKRSPFISFKKIFLAISLLSVITSLSAHEFWLSPSKYIYKRTEKLNIRFFVGENFEGQNWNGNKERIQSLKLYYGGVNDELSEYITDQPGDSIELTMVDEGTNLISFNSRNSYIEMEASEFNKYLQEDGLSDAIDYRKENNETDSMGREFFQRCSKTLIQVGTKKDNTHLITTGLPIDIIPLTNPYLLKPKDSLKVKVLFRDDPLSNTLVKIWHRINGKTIKTDLTTNEYGEIIFPVSTNGKWMVSLVKMVRLESDPAAQWQSYWGSLTWGYQ